ncbi:MAG: DUF1638 domain-containing protein [Candidatus Methanomethylophilaceae archaeon]|nr:DUF1638 domain-containing protein [Candidatus Methanomethylophilaceae archaeon]
MKLGIIACDILKPEIEHLTENDSDFVVREYLEFALHENPQRMREVIIETVNKYEGQLDAIFLGYAICQSLDGVINELKVPAVMLDGADCIDVLLTTKEYNNEKRKCAGTWFSSPGWALEGTNGLIKEMHLDSVEGVDPQFFLDILFDSYERCLFIDTGIGNEEYYEQKSKEMADQLKLRHECRKCGLEGLTSKIEETKELARSLL